MCFTCYLFRGEEKYLLFKQQLYKLRYIPSICILNNHTRLQAIIYYVYLLCMFKYLKMKQCILNK